MIGISSNSTGVLFLPKPGTAEYAVLEVIGGEEQDSVEAKYLYSAAQDWKEIEGSDAKALLEIATRDYWLARSVSLIRDVIGGLESSLEKRVLEHVEELFGSRVSSERALNHLLVAPLIDPRSPLEPAKSALSYGFSLVASVLDELADLQPLLHRLTDHWLDLSETVFSRFSESREIIWMTVVEKGDVKPILKSTNRADFTNKWNLLALHFATAQSRLGVNNLGYVLSQRLFPHERQKERIIADIPKDEKFEYDELQDISSYEAFKRVEKQIAAVAHAVSQGKDAKGEKFLRELVQEQTSFSGGESYAVKSLCNIAQRCADMYRTDFELICIEEALRLQSSDTWTLTQHGDHLKRIGRYDEAVRVFRQATVLGEGDVVTSCIADVYSQQGEYAKSINIYKSISNWSENALVLTAIADTLRKMGCLEDAQDAYDKVVGFAQPGLIEFADAEIRARVGIAEIAKKQGRFEDASQGYRRILNRGRIDIRDRTYYKMGLCRILKLMEKYEEAYPIVDGVVQDYPFLMQARFLRGSILGLIGQELKGLEDLPEGSDTRSWQEWERRYYRGLLLFKLKRYEDAKKNLVEELPKALAFGEDKAILRMAAALYFLRGEETLKVDEILSEIPTLYDRHVEYLSLVLKLHSATQKKDLSTINSLRARIAGIQVVDFTLEKAVAALSERNFSLAIDYETNALLKLAA